MMRINAGQPIRQGDEPHGSRPLGTGPTTIARAGCLLTCFTMAARHCHGDPELTVIEADRMIHEADGYSGTKLRRVVAARALGIEVLAWRQGYEHADLVEAIEDGDPPIIGIDYKRGSSSAKSDADHFVLAVFADAEHVYVADPAVGELVKINIRDPQYRGAACHLSEIMTLGVHRSAP